MATDDFVESINRLQANQAHLWVFSGIKREWLTEWMKEPLRAPKRAVTVLDTKLNMSTHNQLPKLTRKREWVVGY